MEANQYLTFSIDEELFAIEVAQVREVLEVTAINKVPGMPEAMRGIINVRGGVVPVMDLRVKFGMSQTESARDTRIIVMEPTLEGEVTVIGALADSVKEVLTIDEDQIEDPPKIGTRWRKKFLKGIGKKGDRFIIILDIDRIFETGELMIIEEVTENANTEATEEAEETETADV